MIESLQSIDHTIFLLINVTLSHPWLDTFFKTITMEKNWTLPIIVSSVLFITFSRNRKKSAIVMVLAGITIGIADPFCNQILKPYFHRLRPCNPAFVMDGHHLFLEGGRFLLGMKDSFSFPSSHAMNSFSEAALFTMIYPASGYFFIPLAFFVSLSRIYVGVHYPSDVFAGALIGMLLGVMVFHSYCFYRKKFYDNKKVQRFLADIADE